MMTLTVHNLQVLLMSPKVVSPKIYVSDFTHVEVIHKFITRHVQVFFVPDIAWI